MGKAKMTDHPGWKQEGFMRKKITADDAKDFIEDISIRIPSHLENYGDGIFTHPHEIVGCMYGQLMKLSKAADESIYTGDLDEFKERCMKTLMAMIVGTISVDKLIELRNLEENK
jgi:hypothetical protein